MASVFVIMPFGKKPLESGTTAIIDFDDVYRTIIAPACSVLGWDCSRIDDIAFSGAIGKEIIRLLASADIVIADLTAANPNVYFELDIRQSLTERPTVLISHAGTQLPFDIHDQRVLFYELPQ